MSHLHDAEEQAFEQQLERIGEHLRPAPGPRFYQRLAGAPWQGEGMVTKQKAPGRKLAWGVLEVAMVLVVLATWYVLGGSAWLRGLVPGEMPSAAPTAAGEANNPVIDDHTATPRPGEGTGVEAASGVVTPTPTMASMTYTVHDGDTCEGIASYYGVTVAALMEANGIADCATIIPDQVLILPPGPSFTQPAPAGTVEGRAEPGATPTSTPLPTGQALSTADLPATPAAQGDQEAAIVFTRGGGPMDTHAQWTIYADGTIALADGPEAAAREVGQVTAAQVAALVTRLDSLGFFEMQPAYGANDNCADCILYSVTVTHGGETKTVTTPDAASDAPPELGQALELITTLIDSVG